MSGDRGDDPANAPPPSSTEETAAYVDAIDTHDPWNELTPPEDDEAVIEAAAEWVEAESQPPAFAEGLPSFIDPIPADDLDVTPSFAPVPRSEDVVEPHQSSTAPHGLGGFAVLPPQGAMVPNTEATDPEAPAIAEPPAPEVERDLTEDFTQAISAYPAEVYRDVTPSFAPEPAPTEDDEEDIYVGDGPFAAPVDQPSKKSVASFQREFKNEPVAAPSDRLDQTIMLKRRAAKRSRSVPAAEPLSPSAPPVKASSKRHDRHYPKMRALLQNPDAVPMGSEPPYDARPPVVPGTFFPTKRPPKPTPAPADLDGLLATMAEGLLIGETADGHTEVRVTLKDEFFAGTELRIVMGEGALTAVLVPPDREVYWQLAGNIEALRERLTGRGLRVQDIQVADP